MHSLRPSPPLIRAATPADAPALARLLAEVFAHTYGAALPAVLLDAYVARTFAPARMAAELADSARPCLLAWQGAALAGASCLALAEPPEPLQLDAPLEIGRLYVAAPFQGHGVADALLQATIELARALERRTIWLCAWEANARALGFYHRHGFQAIGTTIIYVDHVLFHDFVLARGLS